jgi:leader peptidase (prepilin peptidase) / N-methyltransferase
LPFRDLILAPFRLPVWETALLFAVVGALLTALLTHRALRDCAEPDRGWSLYAALSGFIACGLFTTCMMIWKVQETPIVRPIEEWYYWRIGHHVMLIALMLALTATDLRAYLIPDRIIWFGITWGLALAFLSGDLQIEQVWVDWNEEIPQLRGPYVPAWLAAHPHLHGLAWSLAGAACGALGTLVIRAVASFALGQEAMGLGDVTLMAMIGAFLGWQPTIVVLLLAPLCGLAVGALVAIGRMIRSALAAMIPALRRSGAVKTYLPYGPFLCLAAYIVMLTWRWIWMFELQLSHASPAGDRLTTFAVRRLFGDWVSLVMIAGITLAALAIALFLRRIYKNLPVQPRTAVVETGPSTEQSAESPASSEPNNVDTTLAAEESPQRNEEHKADSNTESL